MDFTTFGEGGMRLSVPSWQRLETCNKLDVNISGTEGNIAGALSQLGWNCGWVSSLPKNALGKRIAKHYRSVGIDLSSIVELNDGKVGIYFVEYASPPRPTKVIFDRKDSCLAQMTEEDVNWDYIGNSQHIHMSGLTVALSKSCMEIVSTAFKLAKQKGIKTSFDVNFRNQLWSAEEAKEILTPIIQNVDLLFCSRRDAEHVFQCVGDPRSTSKMLAEISNATLVVLTLEQNGVMSWDGENFLEVEAIPVEIVDRIGAGDAMLAGILHGLWKGDLKLGLRYGVYLAAMSLTQFGDMLTISQSELDTIVNSPSLKIQR